MQLDNIWCGQEGAKVVLSGDPVESSRKEKILTKIGVKNRHVTRNFLVIFLLGHLSLSEI